MSTTLKVLINYVDADVSLATNDSHFIELDLDNDYLIWSEGSDDVEDNMTHEPTEAELNAAAVIIDEAAATQVPLCLLMDASHDVGGSNIYTHEVKGVGEAKQFPFCFSFDGPTANEPTLEAWDDDTHESVLKHVLGNNTPAESMIKAICTTNDAPGVDWEGSPLAGADNKLLLNDGVGALSEPASGETHDLYANLKIVIPADYANPAVENFVLTVRYTWN